MSPIIFPNPHHFFSEDLFGQSSSFPGRQSAGNQSAFRDHTVAETEKSFQLSVDLPGVKAADLSLTFDEGVLKISGTRKCAAGRQGQSSSFVKSFAMDQVSVDTTNATANLADGVLIVTVPKRDKPIAQTVTVTSHPHEEWMAVESSKELDTKE